MKIIFNNFFKFSNENFNALLVSLGVLMCYGMKLKQMLKQQDDQWNFIVNI